MGDNIYEFLLSEATSSTTGGVDASENQDPSTVNNGVRAFKQRIAEFVDDLGAVNTVSGSANAITVALASAVTTYATGQLFRFIAATNNSTSVTVNVNSIGAKAVRKISGGVDVATAAGDILGGETYELMYRESAVSSAGGFVMVSGARDASETVKGLIELATNTEAQALSATNRAVTPANVGSLIASQAEMETATAIDRVVPPGRQHFHPGHTKAWVRFDGTGTPAITSSYKGDSISDTTTGRWSVNLSVTFSASTTMNVVGAARRDTSVSGVSSGALFSLSQIAFGTTGASVQTMAQDGTALDCDAICVSFQGDL